METTTTNIVGVKYENEYYPKTFSGKEYTYFSSTPLNVGDLVEAPTKFGTSIALVTSINIPEINIINFKDSLKTINVKLDKNMFINNNILTPAV